MLKGTRVRDQDKFMLRLPDGMRERIKAKSDRAGMSMNEAIIWCLEQHFPAPATLEERLAELAALIAILAQGGEVRSKVERLIDELDATLNRISRGELSVASSFQRAVREKLERWQIEQAEDWEVEHISPFEDEPPVIVRKAFGKEPND